MSVGAICFTSCGSNGGCWVVLVFPRLFFWKKGFFFPIRDLRPPPKKKIPLKKNTTYAKKKGLRDLRRKKIKKRVTLISAIELRFPTLPCHCLAD